MQKYKTQLRNLSLLNDHRNNAKSIVSTCETVKNNALFPKKNQSNNIFKLYNFIFALTLQQIEIYYFTNYKVYYQFNLLIFYYMYFVL